MTAIGIADGGGRTGRRRLRDPTGNTHVLRVEHMRAMKDGAVLANSGHFKSRDLDGLKQAAQGPTRVREFVTVEAGRKARLRAGRRRLINLAAAEGHPRADGHVVRESGARC